MTAERLTLEDPGLFFRFAVSTTLFSIVAVTLLLALRMAIAPPDTISPANTEADHWGAVGLVAYFGVLLFLPISAAVWVMGWPVLKAVHLLGGGAAIAGALMWFALFGWLAIKSGSYVWLGPTFLGGAIGAVVARAISGRPKANETLQEGGRG